MHTDKQPLGARGPELHNIGPAWDATTGGGSRIGEILRHEFDVDVEDLDTSLTTVGVRASYRF